MNSIKCRIFGRIFFGLSMICGSTLLAFAGGADVIREWNLEATRLSVPSGPPSPEPHGVGTGRNEEPPP